MSETSEPREEPPEFYGWCDEDDRLDAFVAALSAFVAPGGLAEISISPAVGHSEGYGARRLEEVIALVRSAFGTDISVSAGFSVPTSFGHEIPFGIACNAERYERWCPTGPLSASCSDQSELLPQRIEVAVGSTRSVEVEAAVFSVHVQQDVEAFLIRLCASDGSRRVVTGGCSDLSEWGPPIEMAVTYHADVAFVARDLALSWVRIHDGYHVARAAGMSLDALRARVEAAPQGTRIPVTGNVIRAREHCEKERLADIARLRLLSRDIDPRVHIRKLTEIQKREDALLLRGELPPHGTRVALPGDAELTREQVLAVLSIPPATLLEALEASAVPDDEWRAVEPLALETIQAAKEGVPTAEVRVLTGKHGRFIERHAPYHVRRLPNGGVLLATHPYRTLWPLWADALLLLGIWGFRAVH
jgi:hypothetical protein